LRRSSKLLLAPNLRAFVASCLRVKHSKTGSKKNEGLQITCVFPLTACAAGRKLKLLALAACRAVFVISHEGTKARRHERKTGPDRKFPAAFPAGSFVEGTPQRERPSDGFRIGDSQTSAFPIGRLGTSPHGLRPPRRMKIRHFRSSAWRASFKRGLSSPRLRVPPSPRLLLSVSVSSVIIPDS